MAPVRDDVIGASCAVPIGALVQMPGTFSVIKATDLAQAAKSAPMREDCFAATGSCFFKPSKPLHAMLGTMLLSA